MIFRKNNMRMVARWIILSAILLAFTINSKAQSSLTDAPIFGAEVFIEPGQTPAEIHTFFDRLKQSGMTVTRIRMFESYMHRGDGSWDYSLFDTAFTAAQESGIKVYANFFPATSFEDVGGFKFPHSQQHLDSIADYIQHVVTHFKKFSSLYGWVPINEPGSLGHVPTDAFTRTKFNDWKKEQVARTYNSRGYTVFDFSEQRFLTDYNTWFLNWLSKEIRKYDATGLIHVNSHAIFENVAEYDFPKWRNFLTSLGGSAHASWHFGYFKRDQYTLAMSANAEIIRSGAGNIPWLMTELQGGNNTYSGGTPMCPTPDEIAQWLWATLASGSKGAIFWSLNPRSSGFEAGEWAMLNYKNEPSDRLSAAAAVIKTVTQNKQLFANARVAESGINVLYSRESLWIEKKLKTSDAPYEGRQPGGAMKSALAYFNAFSEMGVQCNLKEMGEYDFGSNDYTGQVIVLSQQISIPSAYWPKLTHFVAAGGKIIADGLTAYYDENAFSLVKDFPLQDVFGASIKEFKVVSNLFEQHLDNPAVNLPAHLWRGTMATTTAKPIGFDGKEITATRNSYKKGEVVWIPSLIGMGARVSGNDVPLTQWLNTELKEQIKAMPLRFGNYQKGVIMKLMKSGNAYMAVIINKSGSKVTMQLEYQFKNSPQLLFATKATTVLAKSITIENEDTVVLKWEL